MNQWQSSPRSRLRRLPPVIWICAASFAIGSCEIGNIIRKESAPDFGPSVADGILLSPPLDRSGTLDPAAFAAAFHLRLRDYRPEYRFQSSGDTPALDFEDLFATLDAIAAGQSAVWPEFQGREHRHFAVTVVHENSLRRETHTEYSSEDSGWRELVIIKRVFRADFMIFAPGRNQPIFFAQYERESEQSNADEYEGAAEDDETPGQICVNAFGQCLFDSALQIASGGRADSRYDDDVSRFMKAIALELPES